MNPILQALRNRQGRQEPKGNDFSRILADINAGKIDPRQKVMEMVGNLSQAEKIKLRLALPMIQSVAMKQGGESGEIQRCIAELKAAL